MVLHDVLHDAEPQSAAAGVAAAGGVAAEEAFEHSVEFVFGYSDPLVGYRYFDDSLVLADADADAASGRGVLNGVRHEVMKCGDQKCLVAIHFDTGIPTADELDFVPFGDDSVLIYCDRYYVVDVD